MEYGWTVKYKWFSGNIMLGDFRQHEIPGGMVTEGERKFMQEDVIRVYYIHKALWALGRTLTFTLSVIKIKDLNQGLI